MFRKPIVRIRQDSHTAVCLQGDRRYGGWWYQRNGNGHCESLQAATGRILVILQFADVPGLGYRTFEGSRQVSGLHLGGLLTRICDRKLALSQLSLFQWL